MVKSKQFVFLLVFGLLLAGLLPAGASPEAAQVTSFTLTTPGVGDRVTYPVHLAGYLSTTHSAPVTLRAQLTTYDGQVFSGDFNTLTWGSMQVFVYNLDDTGNFALRPPLTSSATLEIFLASTNTLLETRQVTMLGQNEVVTVPVYFLQGGVAAPVLRQIPPTFDIGRAALEEIMWGLTAREIAANYVSAIPIAMQTQSYTGGTGGAVLPHVPEEGGIVVANGSATLTLPGLIRAGSPPALAAEQLRRTLLQFEEVETVTIVVDGVLWP
jgi:hypothetical protein